MILINLLPHREAARKRRKEAFAASVIAAVLLGGGIGVAVFGLYQAQILNQQERNQFLTTQIATLDSQIKDIANLQAEIASLRARQGAVEGLQADRNLPVHLLNEMVKQLPDGVYINSMRQTDQTVMLQGVAQSNERVSELLRNLANNSLWLARPELIEITAGSVALSARDQRRVANFTMRVGLRRAADVQKELAPSGGKAAVAPAKS
ncbi:PilN domain-containing protein [Variovorax sp. VNK109]|uniref:PilN domain-containing protein n=1 Tax=Variovorax sp. VNK109 TaxID=3400919 RepID=UPI003C02789E